MKARDVMSKAVVSVTPDCSIEDMAKKMEEYCDQRPSCHRRLRHARRHDHGRRSPAPHRASTGSAKDRCGGHSRRRKARWPKSTFRRSTQGCGRDDAGPDHGRREYSLEEVIHLMEKHRIKRVPVVRVGAVVGVVSCANLVQALAGLLRPGAPRT